MTRPAKRNNEPVLSGQYKAYELDGAAQAIVMTYAGRNLVYSKIWGKIMLSSVQA